ncbi:hypothetical protein chiPu_0011352 [Chiloscyllium punctatum]|uniref:C2H2-type domain-containing protein n=1 Tax=Chiloscyllium punctatum TaxID=137246 RepID=A0A401SR71_CHIPU|nr:hypothetical protein [Chiloscyllium punctatum]
MVENRRFQAESTKTAALHSMRGGIDPHQPLHCLSKPCDLLLDSEAASDPKDDPFKFNIFSGTGSSSISLTASDLEIDDAKLDSLINETLNGLDYQSDNAEIDSSFIEAFADDEFSTTKSTVNGSSFKTKDCVPLENKINTKSTETEDKQAVQMKVIHNNGITDRTIQRKERNKHPYRKSEENDSVTVLSSQSYSKKLDKFRIKNFSHEASFDPSKYNKPDEKIGKSRGGRKLSADTLLHRRIREALSQPAQSLRKNPERNKHKGNSDNLATIRPTPFKVVPLNDNSRLCRSAVKDIKKRKSGSRTWSKELIQKIVQQKNKLHKLHVKGNKKLQVPLIPERLIQPQHRSNLREYDYISDSDQETEPQSSKYPTPRLNRQAKYSIAKEHKSKCGQAKAEESWRYIKIRKTSECSIETEGHNQKKGYNGSRIKRRSSRAYTSSDCSNITSSLSENTNSPNSVERSDSDSADSEKDKNIVENEHPTLISSTDHTMQSNLNATVTCTNKAAKIAKDSLINDSAHSRGTKKFGSAKFLLSGRRSQRTSQSMMQLGYYNESHASQKGEMENQNAIGSNTNQMELCYAESRPQTGKSFEKNVGMTSTASVASNTELVDQRVMENFSSCEDIIEYPKASASQNSSIQITELTADMKDQLTDINKKMKSTLGGSIVVYEPNTECFCDKSSGFNIEDHTAENSMTTIYCGHKDLENQHHSNIFSECLPGSSTHLEDIFFYQNESGDNYLQKNHVKKYINAYSREKYQAKAKSPVPCSPAGIFGDITISSFDSQLYADTSLNKGNYYGFSCGTEDSRTDYNLQYPPLLEHKDWSLLQDMTTILPEEISHFEDLSVEAVENKSFPHTEGTSSTETLSLLPERVNDQNNSFNATLTDDDLEIKRLVTELENQLQTPKQSNDISVVQVNTEQYMNVNLKDQTALPTSLQPEQGNGCQKNIYIPNNNFSSASSDMHTTEYCTDKIPNAPNSADHSTVGSVKDNEDIWTCSFQIVSLDAEPNFQTPDKVCEDPCSPPKDNQSCFPNGLKDSENAKENKSRHSNLEESNVSSQRYSEKPEEKLESQQYTENLIASLAIISDSVLDNNSLVKSPNGEKGCHILSKNENCSNYSRTDRDKSFQLPSRCVFSEHNVAEKNPEQDHNKSLLTLDNTASSSSTKDASGTEIDISSVHVNDSQEKLLINLNQQCTISNQLNGKTETSALLSESEEAKLPLNITSPTNSSENSPLTKYKVRANSSGNPSFIVKSSTEQYVTAKKIVHVSQDSTENPLQQLQLLVDRTVPCNEQLMKVPCCPVLDTITNQISNSNNSSEQNEQVFNSTHDTQNAINAKDKSIHVQAVSNSEFQTLDTDTDTKNQDCLPSVLCVSENIAETVTEKVKENSNSQECAHSEVHSMVTRQLLTLQIPGSQHLKKIPETNDDVDGKPDLTENKCSLLAREMVNENPAMTEGKQLSDDAYSSQNSDESSVLLTFKGQAITEKITSAVLTSDILGSAANGKQCVDILQKTLQFNQPNCPLTKSYTDQNDSDKNKLVKHLPIDDIPQCKPTLATGHVPVSYSDDLHNVQRPDHYETISINDAIMLHTSHKSKNVANECISVCDEFKRFKGETHECKSQDDLKNTEISENDSSNIMDLLYQSKIETASDAVLNSTIWSNPQQVIDLSTHGDITSFVVSTEKASDAQNQISIIQSQQELSESLSSQMLEPYDSLNSDDCILKSLDTDGIQVLNQNYEIPDKHLFGSPEHESSSSNVEETMSEETSQDTKLSKVRSEEGKTAKNRSDISIKSKEKQYKCKVCFQWFLTLGELDFHKLSHNPSPPPTCYMCVQRKFSSREQLRDHLKEKHAKNKAGIWTCGMCLKEISDVWMYNEHLREHATQFARKGQAQKSAIGFPSCFSEDSAMTSFFNTLLNKKHGKSTKTVNSVARSLVKETKVPKANQDQAWKTKERNETSDKNKLNFTSALKLSSSSNPELMQQTDATQKNISMHPDCKDPSRDCHHCGKQFPKPFKLQRHLVVHSLQKIYLCYKCPIFYLENKELRTHLKDEHKVIEEAEVKHTTLYTCELCADVMHVIKKSFICSTCNYTFSKKEQYDRHMEKHLAGGSKTHKFRGVMRPHLPVQDEIQDSPAQSYASISSPPNKKQKVNHDGLTEINAENSILTIPSTHVEHSFCEGSENEPPDFLPDIVNDIATEQNDLTPKHNDIDSNFSEFLVQLEQSESNIASSPPCLSPAVSHPLSNNLVDLDIPPVPDEHSHLYNMTSCMSSVNTCVFKPHLHGVQRDHMTHEKTKQNELYDSSKQTSDFQKMSCNNHITIAATDSAKQNSSNSKPSEKQVMDLEAKLSHKKRKEHKIGSIKSNSNCRIAADEGSRKRKQMRTDSMKKSDIPQDIIASRDETTGSHLISKAKPWTNSSQSKKNGINFCPSRQLEMRSFNGEFRNKKELISKPLLYSKGGTQSVSSSIRKHRLMQSVKPTESHNYRTAESQSNLLSQLFGQKITSFKIPLRKDTSE